MTNKHFLYLFSSIYLFLSLILYIAIPAYHAHMDSDTTCYEHLGLQFAHNNTFSFNEGEMPDHTNGYPFFLALLYKIFGYNQGFVVLLQVLLGLMCGFLIFSMAKKLFSPLVALISFAFFSVDLGFIVFPQFILSEILLVSFLIFFFERFITYMNNRSFITLATSGLLLGLSVLIKPVAIFYIFIILGLLYFFSRGPIGHKLKILGVFALAFYLPITGYMLANKITYNRFCLSPLAQANLYIWFHSKIKATQNHTSHIEEMAYLPSLNNPALKDQFFTLATEHPLLAVKVWMKEVSKTFFGLFTTNLKILLEPSSLGGDTRTCVSFFNSENPSLFGKIGDYISAGTTLVSVKIVGFLEIIINLLRYILALIGFIILVKKRQWFLIALFGSYLFYFSMITGHDGCARYRLMFEFILIILAALAVTPKKPVFVPSKECKDNECDA